MLHDEDLAQVSATPPQCCPVQTAARSMSATDVWNQQCAMIIYQNAAVDISPMVQVCFPPAMLILSFNNHYTLHIGVMKLQLGYFCMPTAVLTEHCRVWRA